MSSSLSSYALRMARLSARIFGEVARPTDTKSMKVVQLLSDLPMAKRKEVYDWYPPHRTYANLMRKLRFYGLYRCPYPPQQATVTPLIQIGVRAEKGRQTCKEKCVHPPECYGLILSVMLLVGLKR
ncbi:UNVERIFIED_CONTAM: hypothetical protein K2H54_074926 [Gekko kuhli]